jgi:NUDIX domain
VHWRRASAMSDGLPGRRVGASAARRSFHVRCADAVRQVVLDTVYRVTAADADVRYVWYETPVPPGLEITQVYRYLICPQTAQVLVQDDDGVFNLPGGTPEPFDADLFATLAREAAEENQVRVSDAVYLGFQEVYRPERAPYAQVRMTGLFPVKSTCRSSSHYFSRPKTDISNLAI